MKHTDSEYLQILLDAIRVCAHYKPKFGQGAKGDGLTLQQFRELYQADVFYSWFGLDNPMMYAAHKAAGGMTSVYRQTVKVIRVRTQSGRTPISPMQPRHTPRDTCLAPQFFRDKSTTTCCCGTALRSGRS